MRKLWILITFLLCISMHAMADIAFLSDRDGKSNIYVMNDQGGNVRRVTDTPYAPGNLSWSPDGQQIAFALDLSSTEPGKPQQVDIFVMNADGSRQRNLTQHPALDAAPTWSPDGKLLSFTSTRSGNRPEIYVMEIATRKVRQLTDTAGESRGAAGPAWSPDGRKILYRRDQFGHQLYSMNPDGRNDRPLLRKPRRPFGDGFLLSGFASWSPDGEHILYNEAEHGVNSKRVANRVIIVNNQGRNLKVLDTPKKWLIDKVCWADDGRAVLFAAVANGFVKNTNIFKIYKYRLSDGRITNLTDHPSDNWGMAWTPHTSLSVSAGAKLTTQWARLKAASAD